MIWCNPRSANAESVVLLTLCRCLQLTSARPGFAQDFALNASAVKHCVKSCHETRESATVLCQPAEPSSFLLQVNSLRMESSEDRKS